MKTTEQILRDQIADLERLVELKDARLIELEMQLKRQTPNYGMICKCGSTVCMCKQGTYDQTQKT